MNIIYFTIKEHPIHPPQQEGDPFDIEVLPNINCKLKFIDGVVRIFDHNNNYVYPDLKMFVDDYHLMVNLISNGPL